MMRVVGTFAIFIAVIIVLGLFSGIQPNPVKAADITISDQQGTPGSTTTIKGNGFAGKTATIYWDETQIVEEVPISDKGNIEYDLVIPYAPKGEHVIYIDDDSHWSGSTASINFTVLPSIRVFPNSGKELTQITINGNGFESNETNIGIIWDGKTKIMTYADADKHGTWNATFTVPDVAKGEHYFSAFGNVTNADEIEQIAFIVTPWAKIEPTSGTTDTMIDIELWGLQTSEIGIKITWDGAAIKSNLISDTKGNLTNTIKPRESSAGDHLIQVIHRVSTKSGNFPDLYFKVMPKMELQTATNETGTSLTLTGTGFAKNEPLTITLDNKVINSDLSTDSKGSFDGVLQVPKTEKTEHILTVKDESGNSDQNSFVTEKVVQLTVPQPMSPAEGYKTIIINSIPDALVKYPGYILGKNISMPPITFIWSKLDIEGGVNYVLQVAPGNDFSAAVIDTKISGSYEYTLPEESSLLPGTYSWRVKAVDNTGVESSWSQVHKLEIELMSTQALIMTCAVLLLSIAFIALIIWRIYVVIAGRRSYY